MQKTLKTASTYAEKGGRFTRIQFNVIKRRVSFTISELKAPGLPNRTSYLNFSHISVVTFGLSSISKNLRRKRTSVRLSSGEKTHFSHLILVIAATTSGLHKSFARTFMVEEEDAVVLGDVKMRIGEAVENKAADKVIGAWVISQPIVFCTRERS